MRAAGEWRARYTASHAEYVDGGGIHRGIVFLAAPMSGRPLEALRLVLHAVFAWCAGAIFAVVWLWLFFGIQLDTRQARGVIVLFALLGLCFGLWQAWRQHRAAQSGDRP